MLKARPRPSPEDVKKSKLLEYSEGYYGTSERSNLGIRGVLSKCWDSGKEDKEAGKEKTPRCGDDVLGGRKRRKTKRSKKSKKTKRRH